MANTRLTRSKAQQIRRAFLSCSFVTTVLWTAPAAAGDGIETAGEVLKYALPATAGAISLYHQDNSGLLQLGVTWAASLGTGLLLQNLISEERPDHSGDDSFPSDSTASAFAAASYLQKRYGWDYGLPAYAVATFVGYSRVEADKHHWYDVAAGALIGWGIGQLVTSPYHRLPDVHAYAGSDGAGFSASWRW